MVMRYWPAFGAVDVPHPRTPADILLRSLAHQTFCAVAYGHLLYLLGFRRPHGIGSLPSILIFFSVLVPELVLVQLGVALLPIFISSYRQRIASRFKVLPVEIGLLSKNAAGPNATLGRLGLHAAFAVFNAIPLGAVLGAYRQRLGMQWHGRTYVANLGLDHRNGWAAVGGLAAVIVTLGVIGGLSFVVAGGLATGETGLPTSHISVTNDNDRGKPEAHPEALDLAVDWFHSEWSAGFEVVGAALFHQILLAIAHYPVPLLLFLQYWYLWPVAALMAFALYKRRRIDKASLAFGLVLVFVVFTVTSQIVWDFHELWQVSHEILWYWNWRWKVKDQVSAKFTKDV